jgi:two-component system, chemotaxis family, protein-glutamate methylesterase/glutaminase
MTEGYTLDRPTGLSCPECGGVTAVEYTGTLLQFRCHIGHVLTAETMLVAQFMAVETKLAACLAALNERAELCRQMGEAAAAQGQDLTPFDAARQEALERAEVIKGLLESEWLATGRDYAKNMKGWSVPK